MIGFCLASRKDVAEEDESRALNDGDVIGIEVMPIPQRIADYLNSLNNGNHHGNPMLDGPYCLGYFLAAPLSKTQLIYHPAQIPDSE